MEDNLFDISKLSSHLFWDVPVQKIETNKNKSLIIQRVLDYGFFQDWQLIYSYYGIDDIINTAKNISQLDRKSASFLAHLSHLPLTDFACYSTRQSTKKHWDF